MDKEAGIWRWEGEMVVLGGCTGRVEGGFCVGGRGREWKALFERMCKR